MSPEQTKHVLLIFSTAHTTIYYYIGANITSYYCYVDKVSCTYYTHYYHYHKVTAVSADRRHEKK